MLQVKISSKNVVVATIDFSKMETLRRKGILSTEVILKMVEDKMECQLPYYDKIYHNAAKGTLELVRYEDCVVCEEDGK